MLIGRKLKRTVALALLAGGLAVPQAHAQTQIQPQTQTQSGDPVLDYAALNAALVDDYVLPRYAAFAEATAALEASLTRACADGRADAAESGEAYNAAMDAWMGVQHLRFGPSELFLRTERIEFWPDKRGTVARHLAQMLSEADPHALETVVFANGSVAVQGFPALERLLFDSDAATWTTPFACQLTVAIGGNLKTIAAGLLADWQGGDVAYADVIRGAAEGNERYFDAKEASLEFAKALRGAILLVQDYKLGRPLGKEAGSARDTRAESWRSGRSLRNVLLNLKAAQALYEGGGNGISFSSMAREHPQGAELDRVISAALERLIAAVEAQPSSLVVALQAPDGWAKLDAIRVEARQLLELMGGPLSEVLELPMGFNSYDGD
ncbi:MAG: imelysin family protein [Kiloniellaceae bacterium]